MAKQCSSSSQKNKQNKQNNYKNTRSRDAEARVAHLWRAARALQQSLPAVSRSYVLLMRKIATRVNLQLDCENVKRHTCKRCGSIFQPGRNTFVRVRRQRLVLHCKICGAFRRFPIKFVASGSVAPAIPNVVRSVPVRGEENTPFSPTSATAVTRDER
jgi:RNase P subunit RPR2